MPAQFKHTYTPSFIDSQLFVSQFSECGYSFVIGLHGMDRTEPGGRERGREIGGRGGGGGDSMVRSSRDLLSPIALVIHPLMRALSIIAALGNHFHFPIHFHTLPMATTSNFLSILYGIAEK